MRITRLYMKNFVPIYAGLGKYEIDLDFSSSNKVINLIIGRMGSCKTVILGHLQPFHSFGTLDIRNQDISIIPEEDGRKIIEYVKDDDIYVITHEYQWTKTAHTVKSYITKNDVELNQNGNQGTFKAVIEAEFGIEQNFLRLLRLGPNVANLIRMKAAERKSFIASLRTDTEIYTMLYKRVGEDLRTLNSQLSMLSDKLHNFGTATVESIQDDIDIVEDTIRSTRSERDTLSQKMYVTQGIIASILKNESRDAYSSRYTSLIEDKECLSKQIDSLSISIIELSDEKFNIEEINRTLGSLDSQVLMTTKTIQEAEEKYFTKTSELNKLNDSMRISINPEYISRLKEEYAEMKKSSDALGAELTRFHCDYTASFVTLLIGDLRNISIMIDDVSQYNSELVKKLFASDSSVIGWSRKQIEILGFKKLQLQKSLNNIKFSEEYTPEMTMFLPPFCPTKTCPYYKTHPYNHKKDPNVSTDRSEADIIHEQIDTLDIKINVLVEYPIIYSKLNTLKTLWQKNSAVLTKLGALKNKSLLETLINFQHRVWYDYDILVDTAAMCEKRDTYYKSTQALEKIRNELSEIEINKDNSAAEKIKLLRAEVEELSELIRTMSERSLGLNNQIKSYNELYIRLSSMERSKQDIVELTAERKVITDKIDLMRENVAILSDSAGQIAAYTLKINEIDRILRGLMEQAEQLKLKLGTLKYTRQEFEDLLSKKEDTKYVVDAVSTKEGIPLILVKMFLNNCRDIVNELISDVFGDAVEILEFDINENDFKIPYAVNGIVIDDIEKASQGQQSIISIALSFALLRESMIDYNIMLLDEVDGPLYEHDRQKFISILFKQLQIINAEQVFLISHNNLFSGVPINVIMTTEEIIDDSPLTSVMYV